jgi:hypothetical protein
MGRAARLALFAMLALGVESLGPSCSSGINTGPIRAFNRPVSVAFACIDTSNGNAVPTAQCALVAGVAPLGFDMHALVPQETRGEVAAADLITRTVLDSDRRIPGYTFVPVGTLPGAIIVPPQHPRCTYVANRGSNEISVLETRRFRSTTSFVTFPSVALPGSPTDMVMQSDESALWVALADEGMVIRLPILTECELGDPDLFVDLGTGATVPAGVPVGGSVDLSVTCPTTFIPVPPAMVAPREPDVEPSLIASPTSLALDEEAGVLLAGDRNLPVIHRIVLDDGTLLPPLATGAPVSDVAITPRVPDTYDPVSVPTTFSRYVYAIDEDDGSVMAIEYSDETRADFGAVIPIDVVGSTRPDRIPLGVAARTLEILTPSYDESSGDDPRVALCDKTLTSVSTPGPSFLRGVFLGVGAADGSVRFVDVYDLDATCRGRTFGTGTPGNAPACDSPTIVSDIAVYIRRHRPRGASFIPRFGVITQPSVILGAATVLLDANGSGGTGATVPSLAEVTCPSHLHQMGDSAGVLQHVCGLVDPFASVAETWSAAWQGSIPGTGTGGGNAGAIGADTVEIESSIDYCARGVIGTEDAVNGLPADAPESGYLGDLLAITGALPTGRIDQAICRAVVGVTTIGEPQLPVLVPIQRAYSRPTGFTEPHIGRLVIDVDAPLVGRPPFTDGSAAPRDLTVRDALGCYGDQLLAIDVRSQGAFTVIGGRSGFSSRVRRDETDGHCAWDPTVDVLQQGRAFLGRTFVNARIAFLLQPPTTFTGNPDVRITIAPAQTALGVDLTLSTSGVRQISLPSYLSWNESMGRLYAVDVERRGLVEITMLPLGVSATRFE